MICSDVAPSGAVTRKVRPSGEVTSKSGISPSRSHRLDTPARGGCRSRYRGRWRARRRRSGLWPLLAMLHVVGRPEPFLGPSRVFDDLLQAFLHLLGVLGIRQRCQSVLQEHMLLLGDLA